MAEKLTLQRLKELQEYIGILRNTSEDNWKIIKFADDVPMELRDAIFTYARARDELMTQLEKHNITL